MASWRCFDRAGLARQRERYPVLLKPLERMLQRGPWLADLDTVRLLWSLMFVEYADDVAGVPWLLGFDSATPAQVRAGLVYFLNTLEDGAIELVYANAHADISRCARGVPALARSSHEALDTAIAEVALAVRRRRASRRLAQGVCV